MRHNNKTENYTEFFYYAFRNILIFSLLLTIISTLILGFSVSHSSATNSGSDNLAITISSSCTLSSVVNIPHSTEVYNGNYLGNTGKTTITTLCNDGNGYAVYANGYSNNEEGNNKLINSEYPQYSIDTGLNTSGLTSTWAMKLNNIENDPSPTPPTIETPYNDAYGLVPSYWTKVASRASGTTDMAQGSSFTTTYAVYASSSQYAGTYNGQVKYLLTHPNNNCTPHFMQNIADWKNDIPNTGDTALAMDTRDSKYYYVTRLADGHIWMTQNLDFDIDTNTVLNSTTTDLNVLYNTSTNSHREYQDGYTNNGDIIYWKPASTATTIDFEGTTVTGWASSDIKPYSASKTDSTEASHASLGNHYNWTAAIASNDSSSLTRDTISDISKNPQNSICPKGWRLPTISNQSAGDIGSTNEFARLNNLYNGGASTIANLLIAPLYFRITGYIDSGTLRRPNTDNYSWASSVKSNNNAYVLSIWSGGVNPSDNLARSFGFSVRCVAR